MAEVRAGEHEERGIGMRKYHLTGAVAIVALVVTMLACGDDDESAEETARDVATTLGQRVEGATRLNANLTGSAEVPNPGDPDASGTARINIDVSKREICYEVAVQRIDRPTAMHIHEAETGKAGSAVVTLNTPTASDTTTTGCTSADAALIGRLTATPGNFYVNVHSQTYPDGAARGQLSQ
jgi:hypothetical protein